VFINTIKNIEDIFIVRLLNMKIHNDYTKINPKKDDNLFNLLKRIEDERTNKISEVL